jgi:hypothetical protein
MAEQDIEVVREQDELVATEGDDGDTADDSIDDLEFLIDDIEDQIAPLGL